MQSPQSGDSDPTGQHSQSYEQLTIKQEYDDNSLAAVYENYQSHRNDKMDIESEGDLHEKSSSDYRTPDGHDGRDEPIQSIEDHDDTQSGVGTSPVLRGVRHSEENIGVIQEDQNDDDDGGDDNEGEVEPQINMDDYYESDDDFEDNYDVDSEDLAGYRVERTKVGGIAAWPQEVARAHKAIALRGAYSLMPSSWHWDFIDHPFVEGLFAPAHNLKKVIFQQQSNQFRGR